METARDVAARRPDALRPAAGPSCGEELRAARCPHPYFRRRVGPVGLRFRRHFPLQPVRLYCRSRFFVAFVAFVAFVTFVSFARSARLFRPIGPFVRSDRRMRSTRSERPADRTDGISATTGSVRRLPGCAPGGGTGWDRVLRMASNGAGRAARVGWCVRSYGSRVDCGALEAAKADCVLSVGELVKISHEKT